MIVRTAAKEADTVGYESRTLRLADEQLAQAGEALARAFFDDPMILYLFPDEAQRSKLLPSFMQVGVRLCQPFEDVHTTAGEVHGAACWLPPGHSELTDEGMAQAGALDLFERMGEEATEKFGAMMGQLGEIHAEKMTLPHWYLLLLGVDPPQQGQGRGSDLVAPILRRADTEGLPCYLETMTERNVSFYRKHGFEVVVEDDIAGDGPHFWTMRRDPR